MNATQLSFQDFHVLPNIDRKKRFVIRLNDEGLKRGQPLARLSDLLRVIGQVRQVSPAV